MYAFSSGCSTELEYKFGVLWIFWYFSFSWAFICAIPVVCLINFSWNPKMQTKKSMESSVPYIGLGVLYAYLLHLSWTSETVGLIFASKYLLPEVCIHQIKLRLNYTFGLIRKQLHHLKLNNSEISVNTSNFRDSNLSFLYLYPNET